MIFDRRILKCISNERVTLISIPKEAVDRYLKKTYVANTTEYMKIFQKLPFGYVTSFDDRLFMASVTQVCSVTSGTLLQKQGDPSKRFVFVKKGAVKVSNVQIQFIRAIDFRTHFYSPITLTNSDELYADPSRQELRSGRYETRQLDICERGIGTFFGEECVLTSDGLEPAPFSVLSTLPTTILSISRLDFLECVGSEGRRTLEFYSKTFFPADREIRRYFYESMSWRVFKDGFIGKLVQNKRLPAVPEIRPIHLPTHIKIMNKSPQAFKQGLPNLRREAVMNRLTRRQNSNTSVTSKVTSTAATTPRPMKLPPLLKTPKDLLEISEQREYRSERPKKLQKSDIMCKLSPRDIDSSFYSLQFSDRPRMTANKSALL